MKFGLLISAGALLLAAGCGGSGASGLQTLGGVNGNPAPGWFAKAITMAQNQVAIDYQSPAVDSLGAIVEVVTPQGKWLQAFGKADLAGDPMQPGMQFRAASITKTFTAVGVLQLADMGKLNTGDAIVKYLPNPNPNPPDTMYGITDGQWNGITIEELANHTSGLGYYEHTPGFTSGGGTNGTWTTPELAALIPFTGTTGTFMYRNANFVVLGRLIETITGLSQQDFLTKQFINPLKLTHTIVGQPTTPVLVCHGYDAGNEATGDNPTWASWAGDLVSTADDLTTWIRAVGHNQLLSGQSQATLLTVTGGAVGHQTGFGIQYNGNWYGHLGGIAGYTSTCFYCPDFDASIVVLVNRHDAADGDGVNRAATITNDVTNIFFPGFGTGIAGGMLAS